MILLFYATNYFFTKFAVVGPQLIHMGVNKKIHMHSIVYFMWMAKGRIGLRNIALKIVVENNYFACKLGCQTIQ